MAKFDDTGKYIKGSLTELDKARHRRYESKPTSKSMKLASQRLRRSKARNGGICQTCSVKELDNNTSVCNKCKESHRSVKSKRIREMKIKVISHYGGKCKCCGEDRLLFLNIDHINGNGNKHRKSIPRGSGEVYKWIIKNNFPDVLQILCWNCNCSRQFNNGICPHTEENPIKVSYTIIEGN